MSISGSLSNAMSGLNAVSRAAEVVSSNVANSLTEGYGRRELDLASRSLGGNGTGVKVLGVHRTVDDRIISERRLAGATFGNTTTTADFLNRLERAFGLPDDPASITGRLAQFESSLIEAASRPDSDARLNAVVDTMTGLTNQINSASDQIQNLRLEADQSINYQVDALNDGLEKIAILNRDIHVQLSSGYDANALMDQRQQIIDGISQIVPLRQVPRDNGQIALFTPGGAILLDNKAAVIGFSPVGTIVPQMTQATSALSGLTINGQPVLTTSNGPMAGGSLAGHFAVRDEYSVVGQERLDAIARDLIERFASPTVDPTLNPGDVGIFTDAGGQFNPANEIGLSSRLTMNSLLDPDSGGAYWRLRDGLGAATPGDVGNATQIIALQDALNLQKISVSGGFIGTARSAVGLASDLISLTNIDLRKAESDMSFASAKMNTLKTIELRSGVDTDQEMQQLLLIEQSYAANARVISTIDEMINTLLRL